MLLTHGIWERPNRDETSAKATPAGRLFTPVAGSGEFYRPLETPRMTPLIAFALAGAAFCLGAPFIGILFMAGGFLASIDA